MTLNYLEEISLSIKSREVAMKDVARYRALGSLCRQHAAYNPDESWKLLAQAEHWEHLAQLELASHLKESNADRLVYSTDNLKRQDVNGSRWKSVAAA
jgi:hypothetical protein